MIPVEQREIYDRDAGTVGDCWRCCFASILELPYEEVPHFAGMEASEEVTSAWNAAVAWLEPRGFRLATFALWGTTTPYLKFGSQEIEYHFTAPGHWIATVYSPRVVEEDGTHGLHAIVMHGSSVAWDPHPDRDGGHLGFLQAELLVAK